MTGAEEPDDRELLRAHVAGDLEAFGVLFGRHRQRLWAVALRITGEREEATHALQATLVTAFRRADTFRGDAASTWLHQGVVSACLDRLRRRAVRLPDPLPDDPDRTDSGAVGRELRAGATATVLDPADRTVDHPRRSAVLRALATLTPDQRAALVLVDMEGCSVGETARILDCAEGTVRSRCSRGRAQLLPLLVDHRPSGATPASVASAGGSLEATERVDARQQPAGGSEHSFEQEQQVARVLAETARQEEASPVPAEVSARLDGVLAELTAPRVAADRSRSVDDTDARSTDPPTGRAGDRPAGGTGESAGRAAGPGRRTRPARSDEASVRRRRRLDLLAAAASVAVIAVSGAAVATGGFGASSGTESSAAGPDPGSDPTPRASSRPATPAVPRLRTPTLAADVQRAVDGARSGSGLSADRRGTGSGGPASCPAPRVARGDRLVVVRLDGRWATMLLEQPRSGRQNARVFTCADPTDPVASTTVRGP